MTNITNAIRGWGWLLTGILFSYDQPIPFLLAKMVIAIIIYGLVRYKKLTIVNLIGWGVGIVLMILKVGFENPEYIALAILATAILHGIIQFTKGRLSSK